MRIKSNISCYLDNIMVKNELYGYYNIQKARNTRRDSSYPDGVQVLNPRTNADYPGNKPRSPISQLCVSSDCGIEPLNTHNPMSR
jgi:hypothetical protein